jgi:hypothetical protein
MARGEVLLISLPKMDASRVVKDLQLLYKLMLRVSQC